MNICLQCGKATTETEHVGILEVNVCPLGHRTNFINHLTELMQQSIVMEILRQLEEAA